MPRAQGRASQLQATVAHGFELSGVGLHSGAPARVRVCPAPAGHGRVFVRMDLDQTPIPALSGQVSATALATTLSASGPSGAAAASVSTVEHLLAAAFALNIDNLLVQVWGPELPVLDGSAQPWLARMAARPQAERAQVLELLESVQVQEGERWMRLSPAPSLALEVEIHFEHPAIGTQAWSGGAQDFGEIASARTFGFEAQVQAMHRAGLSLGGSLDNAVVFGESGPINALRFPDEPVRHKALDLFGDLALLGARLRGRVQANRPGHAMTHALLQALWAAPSAWRLAPE